jgi:hypothetical protein
MRSDRFFQVVLVLIVVLVGIVAFVAFAHRVDGQPYPGGQGEPVDCQEDMGCWNCTTMGNHLCGPQPTGPTLIPAVSIVAPVQPAFEPIETEGWTAG